MNDILCAFLIHKANINGGQFYQWGSEELPNFDSANYVSGLEKVLAPLVLIHLRDHDCSTQVHSSQIFVTFSNLVLSGFLKYFITDDISAIEWRMDFFDKLFERVLP